MYCPSLDGAEVLRAWLATGAPIEGVGQKMKVYLAD